MQPRAAGIEIVDHPPVALRRDLAGGIVHRRDLQDPRGQRPRPTEPAAFDRLQFDLRHAILCGERDVEHHRFEAGELLAARRASVAFGERLEHGGLHGAVSLGSRFQPHPEFDHMTSLERRGDQRLHPQPELVSRPTNEAEGLGTEAPPRPVGRHRDPQGVAR